MLKRFKVMRRQAAREFKAVGARLRSPRAAATLQAGERDFKRKRRRERRLRLLSGLLYNHAAALFD